METDWYLAFLDNSLMDPSDRAVPPDPVRPSTIPHRRGGYHPKPTPYRKEGGFLGKKADSGSRTWKKVLKEPEIAPKVEAEAKPLSGRVYSKELIWRVGQEEQSRDLCSLNPAIVKREIKKVPGLKGKHHKPRHVQPKWCADIRQKSDPLTRSIKSLLNKLAPTNYASILSKTQSLLNAEAALAVAVHIFDKASAESKYSELYARLCEDLITGFPDFKSYLVTTCQHVFETTTVDFNFTAEDPEEQKEHRQANRKRILGCVRFIGELATHCVISPMRLLDCCRLLLHEHSERSESGVWTRINEDCIEGFCYLISSCPKVFTALKFQAHINKLIEELSELRRAEVLSPRVGFLIQDILDGGSLKSLCREKEDGPVTLENLPRKTG